MVELWPFFVIGLFSGSVYAMAAMGLVLTYKTSGIFNFAYGGIAMFCGFTFSQFRDEWGITSWISLPLLLFVVAPVIGLLCERLFRTVTGLSAEIQIVVALGVLAFLQALVPIIYGDDRALGSIFPTSTFPLGPDLNVGYDQLFTMLLAIGFGVGLYVVLRRTSFGLSTQAVVDNRDLAEMIGVSSDRVSRAAWMISSVFAAFVGILLSSTQGLNVYNLVILVIYSFAPAVFGKLVSLPLAFAGAMVIGIAQSLLGRFAGTATIDSIQGSLPYLALFALLVFYGGALKEVRSSFRTITTSVPTRGLGRTIGTAGGLLAAGLVLPLFVHGSLLRNITIGLVIASVGITVVVLTGWAGQISLAQFSFVGVGAFTVGHFGGDNGGRFVFAALLGALIALPLGLIVGLPSLRLSGLFLALATMAFALILDTLIFTRRSIGGALSGIDVPRPRIFGVDFYSDQRFYYLALGLFAAYGIGAIALRRGPLGRRLQMIRDAPVGASTFGVNLTLTKLAVFAGCGAAAALAGAFYGSVREQVTPRDFSFGASLQILLLVVLGGRAQVGGALIAGAVSTVQLLPIDPTYQRYLPLMVAVGVVVLAQYPEGPIAIANERSRQYLVLLRPRPREVPAAAGGS